MVLANNHQLQFPILQFSLASPFTVNKIIGVSNFFIFLYKFKTTFQASLYLKLSSKFNYFVFSDASSAL